MKVIIAGSRGIDDFYTVTEAIVRSGFEISEVVSGGARGVDRTGERVARFLGLPVRRFPADWKVYGKSAGYMRNLEMGEYASALIAIWKDGSKGTGHMIDIATKAGLKVYVHLI